LIFILSFFIVHVENTHLQNMAAVAEPSEGVPRQPPADIGLAAMVLEIDNAFQPQARRLVLATKGHSHKQLVQSTYLYTRGVLLAEKADKTGFPSLVCICILRAAFMFCGNLIGCFGKKNPA
jgi:hypothetical protein